MWLRPRRFKWWFKCHGGRAQKAGCAAGAPQAAACRRVASRGGDEAHDPGHGGGEDHAEDLLKLIHIYICI